MSLPPNETVAPPTAAAPPRRRLGPVDANAIKPIGPVPTFAVVSPGIKALTPERAVQPSQVVDPAGTQPKWDPTMQFDATVSADSHVAEPVFATLSPAPQPSDPDAPITQTASAERARDLLANDPLKELLAEPSKFADVVSVPAAVTASNVFASIEAFDVSQTPVPRDGGVLRPAVSHDRPGEGAGTSSGELGTAGEEEIEPPRGRGRRNASRPAASRSGPRPSSELLTAAALAECDAPSLAQLDGVPTSAGLRSLLQWRVLSLLALLVGYLPIALRSLSGVQGSQPIGTSAVALLLAPLVLVVIGWRHRQPATPFRTLDLVVGLGLTALSLVCTQMAQPMFGPARVLVRPDLVSFVLALAATITLLAGAGFAWTARASVLAALLASPLAFVPLLGVGVLPFSGVLNPFSFAAAQRVVDLTQQSPVSISTSAGSLDIGGLLDGRVLNVIVLLSAIALLLAGRSEPQSTDRAAIGVGLQSGLRKLLTLTAMLATWWVLDLVVTSAALIAAVTVPGAARWIASPVVGALPALLSGWTLGAWATRFGLHVPTRFPILRSAARLPQHGPTAAAHRVISVSAIAALSIAAAWNGLQPSGGFVALPSAALPTESSTPAGWQVVETAQVDGFESYFGAASVWTRTAISGPTDSVLDSVHLDLLRSTKTDLLQMFDASSTYRLAGFKPVQSRTIDLGRGLMGTQTTYFDSASSTAWSVATVGFQTPSGPQRISLSARRAGDPGTVPVPGRNATAGLVAHIGSPPTSIAADPTIAAIADATADLLAGYFDNLGSDAATGFDEPAVATDSFIVD